ncbi:Wiz-like isoform X2 [Pelobates cultripes]|uniref:Wiz-like isoform X2 n=1 Tax=Pelobates cultripes TaxID=61616 RepID=A0AAD1RNB5_PELCU|nr:Wiz-like isoform X2 [Pelobates cultripes]
MEPDEIPCGVIGRPEQDHLSSTLASPKFTIPHTDNRTLHHINQHSPSSLSSPWSFSVSDPQQESERRADGVPSEGQYLQTGRFEWASGMDDDGHSTLMMVRSDPPPITMPVFRRALQLGSSQETWQGSNYSEEDAQVEVEEEEDDDEEEEGSVYTCIECSIYFKKKAHLLEHMFQHTQEGEGEGTQAGDGPHTCGECGKCFGEESSLTTHRQLHQESRQKIMEEIRKLESLADEGRSARLQCPKCLFGTNSSKVFVQHAKTHVKKGIGENRTTPSSFRTPAEMHEESSTEEVNDGIWNIAEKEAESEQDWGVDVPQAEEMQYPGKAKRKTPFKENTGDCTKDEQQKTGECCKTLKGSWIPEAAMEVKRKFREALKDGGLAEDGQRQQLREAVAVVVLENISSRKRRSKVSQPWGYSKRLSGEYSSKNSTSPFELQHSREEWAEDGDGDLPLDALLMDPSYEGQLEALGLRSEERECPYCPDRFHNGIGLANHVRGHLNRVGVSYNVRHFISAEEVKAIEQNYSFQKKRKKVANFDPSTFSLMRCEFCGAGFDTRAGLSSHARAHLRDFGITNWELTVSPIHVLARLLARSPGRPLPPFPPWHQETDTDVLGSDEEDGTPLDLGRSQSSKQEPSRLEKMPSDQSTSRTEDPKASRADPARDIRCEFCNEFFENRKGLSSHARSHLRQMGITEWHVNGSPIDTLREIIRKRRPPPPHLSNIKKEPRGEEPNSPTHTHSQHGMSTSGMAREMAISPLGRHNTFLSPLPAKRPPSHEPRLTQSEPKSYVHLEQKACNQSQAKAYVHGEARPKSYMHDESRPKAYVQSEGRPKSYIQGDGRPKVFMQGEGRPKTYMPGERPKPYGQSEIKHKPYSQNDGRPKPYMHGEGKPKGFLHGEGKPKGYLQGEGKLKAYAHIDGKPKAYIQTELPFKVKVKSSPDKAPTSLEACCELCGLYFENRKALASHARAHLRQFGVTEWCVNGSPIETLREWMKQRPQKAGAYLSYIQGGRPFTKKFKRSSQNPKAGAAEKESSICAVPGKMVEAERSLGTSGTVVEKSEGQGHKTERRPTKAAEVPPAREDSITESLPKAEEPRPAPRARPVPSLVPRPPQTSLVKFVGNIYTLKCRFCDIQFQGPLSIQEQWVRHLQHHILEMNFSKSPSPQALASPAQPEPTKAQ